MGRTHRVSTIAAVILSFMSTQASAASAAGQGGSGSDAAQPPTSTSTAAIQDDAAAPAIVIPDHLFAAAPSLGPVKTTMVPFTSSAFGQRGYRRDRDRNDGARAAIILGAAAAIAGTAVLVYANRPDCSTQPTAGGCGYGAKVVGGAVLSAGVAAILVGALTWR
jgi:hypothetical protein